MGVDLSIHCCWDKMRELKGLRKIVPLLRLKGLGRSNLVGGEMRDAFLSADIGVRRWSFVILIQADRECKIQF